MLEKLGRIDHKRYLFGIKRSVEVNSWSWQKVFFFFFSPRCGNPKCGVRLLNILYVPGIVRTSETGRKVTGFLCVPLRSFFLSLILFYILSFFLFWFFFPPSPFFRFCHHRSTIHDITSNHRLTCALPHRTTSSDRYLTVWQQVACLHSILCDLMLALTVCAIDLWP